MNIYERRILPHLIHLAMRQDPFGPYRRRVVADATGTVLELGVGSGLSLGLYPTSASAVIGLDPSSELLARAASTKPMRTHRIQLLTGSAEAIPVDAGSIDTVVTSWTLCSIPDVALALREIRRVFPTLTNTRVTPSRCDSLSARQFPAAAGLVTGPAVRGTPVRSGSGPNSASYCAA